MKEKKRIALCVVFLCAQIHFAPARKHIADSNFPHLRQNGIATQLMVDGKPWLIRGGELANKASSDLAHMATVWPHRARLNLNTVPVGIS